MHIMHGLPSRTASLICLLSLTTGLVLAAPAPASADEKRVTVTFGNPGDRWLDAMKYIRVARAQHDGEFGYAVTFQAQGLDDFTWFWPRKDIDLDGSEPAYDLAALSKATAEIIGPQGKIHLLGELGGKQIFGSQISRIGIVASEQGTLVVRAEAGKAIEVLGLFR